MTIYNVDPEDENALKTRETTFKGMVEKLYAFPSVPLVVEFPDQDCLERFKLNLRTSKKRYEDNLMSYGILEDYQLLDLKSTQLDLDQVGQNFRVSFSLVPKKKKATWKIISS